MSAGANIQAISARIRALLAKTTAAGATEAEAQSAFTKAQELLEKYQLSLSDIEIRAEGVTSSSIGKDGDDAFQIAYWLSKEIALFCDCRTYTRGMKQVKFMGVASDAQMAEWLAAALVGFVQAKALDFILSQLATLASRRDFVAGACERLNERLRESRQTRAQAPKGRELIVLKNQLVDAEWAKMNFSIRRGPASGGSSASAAFAAGARAANEASLHKPQGNMRRAAIGAAAASATGGK